MLDCTDEELIEFYGNYIPLQDIKRGRDYLRSAVMADKEIDKATYLSGSHFIMHSEKLFRARIFSEIFIDDSDNSVMFCSMDAIESDQPDTIYKIDTSYCPLLHFAACRGLIDIVEYLLENGANPNPEYTIGYLPYVDDPSRGFFIIEIIINCIKELNLHIKDGHKIYKKDGYKILIDNRIKKYEDVIILLNRYGTDLNYLVCKNLLDHNRYLAGVFLNRFNYILMYVNKEFEISDIAKIVLSYYMDIRVYNMLKKALMI